MDFLPGARRRDLKQIQEVFHNVGFIHSKDQSAATILEDDEELQVLDFVTCRSMCQNLIAFDAPFVLHLSK